MQTKQLTIILLIFCFLLTQFSCAQKNQTVVKVEKPTVAELEKPTMVQLEHLKGKVKSICITNERGYYINIWFDKTGKIIKKEDASSDNVKVYDNYVYDEEGRLLEKTVDKYHPSTPTETKFVYKYTNDSIRESYLGGVSKEQKSYKYDERGNCILEITDYSHDKEFKEFIYNENNQLIEAFTHHGPVRMNVWIRDKSGRAYEETRWREPMKTDHVFFEYNELGDISLIKLTTINGYSEVDIQGTIDFKKHDKQGNWTERIFQNKSRKDYDFSNIYYKYFNIYETYLPGYHITRTIEYYE